MARETEHLGVGPDERVVVTSEETVPVTREVRERTAPVTREEVVHAAPVDREPVMRRAVDVIPTRPAEEVVSRPMVREPEVVGAVESAPRVQHLETTDGVRWSAIWPGLTTAMSTLMLLGLFGMMVGWVPALWAVGSVWAYIWAVATGVVAFALGGWLTGRLLGRSSRRWGAMNGALVFLLALPVSAALTAFGLSGLLAAFGLLAAGLGTTAAFGAPLTTVATLTGTAGWTLLALVLALAAAAVAGVLGVRTRDSVQSHGEERRPARRGFVFLRR